MLSLPFIKNKPDQKKTLLNFVDEMEKSTDLKPSTDLANKPNKNHSINSASFRIDELIKSSELSQKEDTALNYSNSFMSSLSSIYDMSNYFPPSMDVLMSKAAAVAAVHSNSTTNQHYMLYNSKLYL